MAKYAYVEDNKVHLVVEQLPETWKNISNFFALENFESFDEQYLNSLGWYVIVKDLEFSYNPNTQQLLQPTYEFIDGCVYQRDHVSDTPVSFQPIPPDPIHVLRQRRDTMMAAMRWRYERWERNDRLGNPQVDSIEDMDKYMQALADITENYDPQSQLFEWPAYPPTTVE